MFYSVDILVWLTFLKIYFKVRKLLTKYTQWNAHLLFDQNQTKFPRHIRTTTISQKQSLSKQLYSHLHQLYLNEVYQDLKLSVSTVLIQDAIYLYLLTYFSLDTQQQHWPHLYSMTEANLYLSKIAQKMSYSRRYVCLG